MTTKTDIFNEKKKPKFYKKPILLIDYVFNIL